MACYNPLSAYQAVHADQDGKRAVFFDEAKARRALENYSSISLPCGQCVGCRLERSRQWAVRCLHEAAQYSDNVFVTLTYGDEFLPADRSLCLRDFQLFMKRLRKKYGSGIRFFHCGEYGDRTGRPHFHALLFNFRFPDQYFWRRTRDGNQVWRSDTLELLWPLGLSEIGSVTFESAAYVARYVMKKVTGKAAERHYEVIDPETGEIRARAPEYVTMSRRPGIGAGWCQSFLGEVFPRDRVIARGREMRPPRFYGARYELVNPEGMEEVRHARHVKALAKASDNTRERLAVKEVVARARLGRFKRDVE